MYRISTESVLYRYTDMTLFTLGQSYVSWALNPALDLFKSERLYLWYRLISEILISEICENQTRFGQLFAIWTLSLQIQFKKLIKSAFPWSTGYGFSKNTSLGYDFSLKHTTLHFTYRCWLWFIIPCFVLFFATPWSVISRSMSC